MGTISADRLREGQTILIRGAISYSRLASVITGQALQDRIERERKRGSQFPTDVPHTTVSLLEPQVLFADPSNPTPEELFVQERIFTLKSGDNAGQRAFGIDNKGTILPTVLQPVEGKPNTYSQLVLERELANGLDVTLVLEVYKPKRFNNRGLGIQQVILNEAPRYYTAGVNTDALTARGIVIDGPIRTINANSAEPTPEQAAADLAHEAALSGFPLPANTQMAGGLPMPAPGAQGIVPQQQPAVMPAPVPQFGQPGVETPGEREARLERELAEARAAAANAGGNSAFVGAPAAAGQPSPWDVGGQGPAVYQG